MSAADYGYELCGLLRKYGIVENFGELSSPGDREVVAQFFLKVRGMRKFPVLRVDREEHENYVEFKVRVPEEIRQRVYEKMAPEDAIRFNERYVVFKHQN